MRDIDRALADIGAIRDRIARDEGFRSYGPAAVASTGIIAAAVATGQWIGMVRDPTVYFATWIVAACIAVLIVGVEARTRSRRLRSRLADGVIVAAASDLLPTGMAGIALAVFMVRYEAASLWMLPGLWQIFVSLGLFAASRSLPRLMAIAGGWYMAAGFATLAVTSATHALSPWAMGVPFAVGQLLTAALLRHALGASDAE